MKTRQMMKKEQKVSFSGLGKGLWSISFICAILTIFIMGRKLMSGWLNNESDQKTLYMLCMLIILGYGVFTVAKMAVRMFRGERIKSIWCGFGFFMVICFSSNLFALLGELPTLPTGISSFFSSYGDLGILLLPFMICGIGTSIYGKFLLDK